MSLSQNSSQLSLYHEESFNLYNPIDVLNQEIPISCIDKFCHLVGLIPPSFLYGATQSCQDIAEYKILSNSFAVQVHYIGGHYVVSCQNENHDIVVYDSLPSKNRVQQLMPQLLVLYERLQNFRRTEVKYIVAQVQGATVDCGAFAVANAHLLLSGVEPCSVRLLQNQLRAHLYQILASECVTPFPVDQNMTGRAEDNFYMPCTLQRKYGNYSQGKDSSIHTLSSKTNICQNKDSQEYDHSINSNIDQFTPVLLKKNKRKVKSTYMVQSKRQCLTKVSKLNCTEEAIESEQEKLVKKAHHLFEKKCNEGPVFVCTCCHRLLYKKSVRLLHKDKYAGASKRKQACMLEAIRQKISKDGKQKQDVANQIIDMKYLYPSNDGFLYMCFNCCRTIKKGNMPKIVKINGFHLNEVPKALKDLNDMEKHLIALRIPFMKMVSLPRGKQKAIHGPCVNVPAKIDTLCKLLPRLPGTAHIIPLKLKRKLRYKSAYMYKHVHPLKMQNALHWLKQNNRLYQDVVINNEWDTECCESDAEIFNGLTIIPEEENTIEEEKKHCTNNNNACNDLDDEDLQSDRQYFDDMIKTRGIPYDTCLEKDDIIYSVAPAERQIPLRILEDDRFEEQAFPVLFPKGTGGYKDICKNNKVTPRKYYAQRIMDVDVSKKSEII